MIRINLLGVPHPKRGKRPTLVIPSGDGGEGSSFLVVILVVAALTAGGNFYWWQSLNRQKVQLAKQMQEAEAESKRLANVKARVEEVSKEEANYRRRVDVIDQLRARQSGPVDLLNMVGEGVNRTDAVWLSNVSDQGTSISIEGSALSLDAVANFMQNLRRTGYFKTVEIKETYQDDTVKSRVQSFVFTLNCEKQQPQQSDKPQQKS